MATVHLGRLKGPVGFSKMVAIKRLHPQFAKDPDFVSMFLDEARLAARIRHPNVVPTLDIVADTGELFLVMEYVHGISLHRMVKLAREQRDRVPVDVACGIAVGALRGLHAAHEAKSERGSSLDIVHRDVSPQNVMVGVDGMARVLDFGVAKASWRIQTTRQGQVKGKVSYMAPEQVMGGTVGPWTDVHALGIVLWELLTGQRLFPVSEERGLLARFTQEVKVAPPSALNPDVPAGLDAAVLQALAHSTDERQRSAQIMADQIEAATAVGTSARIGRFVQYLAEDELDQRATRIAEIEGSSVVSVVSPGFGALLATPDSAPTLKTAADIRKPRTKTETDTEPLPPPTSTGEDPSKISMARTLALSSMAPAQPKRPGPTLAIASAVVTIVVLLVLAKVFDSEKPVEFNKGVAAAANSATARPPMRPTAATATVSPPPLIAASATPSNEPAAAPSPAPEDMAEVPAEDPSVVDLAALPVDLAALPVEETQKQTKGTRRVTKAVVRRKPVAAAPAKTTPAKTTPAKTSPNCTPPYTVDERGVRHLKMECM